MSKSRKPGEKYKGKPKRKDPGPERIVGDAAVEAARTLIPWYGDDYPSIRRAVTQAFALCFAEAYGMRAPRFASGVPGFTEAVRAVDFTNLTPEHFGYAHEQLSAWTVKDGELVFSSEKRRGGVDFTPRTLTEPIVRKTLAPVLRTPPYDNPANTLYLRVCDPAVGAGAFLLEAVRQLAQRLVDHGVEKDLLVAKRLVAVHCCYGVDISPFAVASAKIAIWLECRADRMPASWLDHNIRCGDGLVGVTDDDNPENDGRSFRAFHWKAPPNAAPVPELQKLYDEAMALGVKVRKLQLDELSEAARRVNAA